MTEFSSLGLNEALLKGSAALGFTTPTPIQTQAIPALLESTGDFVILAGTGTGKTAAFGLPLLQKLEAGTHAPQALILSPTRELCCQIASDLKNFAAFLPKVSICAVYGGASMGTQIRDLKRGPQIIVATPGRLIDHLGRGTVDLSAIRSLILDEADEMLSMGFREELENILAGTPAEKQTCLFSATMPGSIRAITKQYLNNPVEITALKGDENDINVEHNYLMVNHRDRFEALRRFIAKQPEFYGIVFCRTKDQTREVANQLSADGLSTDALHGDLTQMQRDYVMQRFRNRIIRILVATDVAARGIDVNDLTHVVHYELPHDAESYVHRSGRTGRAGKAGVSLAIATPADGYKLKNLDRRIKSGVSKIGVPTGNDILRHQIMNYVDSLEGAQADLEDSGNHLQEAVERLQAIPKEELIEKLLYSRFKDQIEYYRNQHDIKSAESRGGRTDRGPDRFSRGGQRGETGGRPGPAGRKSFRREGDESYARVQVPMGRQDGITKPELMGLANRAMKGMRFPIGEIRLQKNNSTIEVPQNIAAELARRIEGIVVRDNRASA
jgi:ATP-dependent RNA helicase DeaD